MRGEIHSKTLSNQDASTILSLMQIFYLDNNRYKLVEDFNERPESFDWEKLLAGVTK